MCTPANAGDLIYLNGNPDLSIPMGKVVEAGGVVARANTFISNEVGYMAFFTDSEGIELDYTLLMSRSYLAK